MATMTDKVFHELRNQDWVEIFATKYLMKYKLDEDGYTLMVSDFAGGVYGEKSDEKAVQKRFEDLNPHVKILPHVILKHVKHLLKHLPDGVQTHPETELEMCVQSIRKHYVERQLSVKLQFIISDVHLVIFIFELGILSDNQFKEHVLRPTLLRALILNEEKAALQRKVEELEGKQSSSSSSGRIRRHIEAVYSAMNEINPDGSDVVDSFLYLQKNILPKSPKYNSNVLATKQVPCSSACSSLRSSLRSMVYEEDGAGRSEESNEFGRVSPKREMAEENIESNEFGRVSPKREMAEENIKEEKPSPAKKKKIMKF